MTWTVHVTKPAQKSLRKLPARDQKRVKAALTALRDDPFQGDIGRLKGQLTGWRRRVDNYRIFYDLYPKQLLIVIVAIQRRTSQTY